MLISMTMSTEISSFFFFWKKEKVEWYPLLVSRGKGKWFWLRVCQDDGTRVLVVDAWNPSKRHIGKSLEIKIKESSCIGSMKLQKGPADSYPIQAWPFCLAQFHDIGLFFNKCKNNTLSRPRSPHFFSMGQPTMTTTLPEFRNWKSGPSANDELARF